MYVNTLISLQENIPTYGVEGKAVTGHVTISTPGIIKCYVQNLKRTNNRTFELYVISSKQNTGVKIGELGEEKETKWRVDEQSVMGGAIALKDIDGVAIIVKENELRGVDAILLGFKTERFTVLPILEAIVPRPKPVEVKVEPKQKTQTPQLKEENVSQTQRPIESEKKAENLSKEDQTKDEGEEVVKGVLGKVIGKQILEGKTPGNDVLEYPSPEDPDVKATNENSKKTIQNQQSNIPGQEPGPVIIPQKPPQEPGPVIIPQKPPQEPGPVIIPQKPPQEPGPVIIPQKPPQEPGPVIIPQEPPEEPGPVIIPKDNQPEKGPVPIILPNGKVYIPEGPGPVVIPKDKPEEEPGPVMPDKGKLKKPCGCKEQEDGTFEEDERSQSALNQITEKLKMVKAKIADDGNKGKEAVWHLEVNRNTEEDAENGVKAEETPEEIDYLAEIEKKLQDIQSRLKNVRNDEEGLDENIIEDINEAEETDAVEGSEENKEIRRTESVIGDILAKVRSLKQHEGKKRGIQGENRPEDTKQEDKYSESQEESSKPLQVSEGYLSQIYARGEAVEAFIQEPEDTEWVKVAYNDFLKIPTLTYEWCTQPFITFAFYKYNEILLGHSGANQYYLGIPDIYHPDRRAILSEPIPVERFLCRRNVEPAIGEYGYWIIPLQ